MVTWPANHVPFIQLGHMYSTTLVIQDARSRCCASVPVVRIPGKVAR